MAEARNMWCEESDYYPESDSTESDIGSDNSGEHREIQPYQYEPYASDVSDAGAEDSDGETEQQNAPQPPLPPDIERLQNTDW